MQPAEHSFVDVTLNYLRLVGTSVEAHAARPSRFIIDFLAGLEIDEKS